KIEEIRGVNSDGVISNLELRALVKEVGRGTGPGQPRLYGTTIRFLQMLGLESLDDLPFPDTGELPEQDAEPAGQDGHAAESGETAGEARTAGEQPAGDDGQAADEDGQAADEDGQEAPSTPSLPPREGGSDEPEEEEETSSPSA
ncbi:MAG TPA: SMC-Scp complex subunit ScpB, partial [Candidatus Dormibacteraeota bacterium]